MARATVFWVFVCWGCLSSLAAGAPEGVDLGKARANHFSGWIDDTVWPTSDTLQTRGVPVKEAWGAVFMSRKYLGVVLRPGVGPEDLPDSQVWAIPDWREGNDFLFLRYRREGIGEIEIADGKDFYFNIKPGEGFTPAQSSLEEKALEEMVMGMCQKVFAVPPEAMGRAKFFTSTIDIGQARLGRIVFDPEYPPPIHWYSSINWCSDGKSISFFVSKDLLEHPDRDYSTMAGPPPAEGPRKFRKKL